MEKPYYFKNEGLALNENDSMKAIREGDLVMVDGYVHCVKKINESYFEPAGIDKHGMIYSFNPDSWYADFVDTNGEHVILEDCDHGGLLYKTDSKMGRIISKHLGEVIDNGTYPTRGEQDFAKQHQLMFPGDFYRVLLPDQKFRYFELTATGDIVTFKGSSVNAPMGEIEPAQKYIEDEVGILSKNDENHYVDTIMKLNEDEQITYAAEKIKNIYGIDNGYVFDLDSNELAGKQGGSRHAERYRYYLNNDSIYCYHMASKWSSTDKRNCGKTTKLSGDEAERLLKKMSGRFDIGMPAGEKLNPAVSDWLSCPEEHTLEYGMEIDSEKRSELLRNYHIQNPGEFAMILNENSIDSYIKFTVGINRNGYLFATASDVEHDIEKPHYRTIPDEERKELMNELLEGKHKFIKNISFFGDEVPSKKKEMEK